MTCLNKYISIALLFVFHCSKAQVITTFAGNGILSSTSENVQATSTGIYDPHGGVFDQYGNCYFVQSQGHKISRVDIGGIITTFAGNGVSGYNGDNIPATNANLNYPDAVALDSIGNLYITDGANYRVRKIDRITGIIHTVVGNGVQGSEGDGGAATNAMLYSPWGICFDKHGNMYIGDGIGYKIRKINKAGVISTIIGNGTAGFSGDGEVATAAKCGTVMGLCTDDVGNLYFADYTNNERVRKIDIHGIVTTFAGNGTYAYNGDGLAATNAHIDPLDVKIDKYNNLYIADLANGRIRKINPEGIISTLTGTGVRGYNGDGIMADIAQISAPGGLALDSCGNVYFGDVDNSRFRRVSYNVCDYLNINIYKNINNIFNIYPNPTTNLLNLTNIKPNTTYRLYNTIGKEVMKNTLKEGDNSISLGSLPPGMYILELMGEDGERVVRKVVKSEP